AARFVLGARPEPLAPVEGEATLPERWIHSRLSATIERATRQLDELDLAGYAATVYDFAWSDYCDWFLETAKIDLRREEASLGERARTWRTLADVLAATLRLLHPILPFVTEEIWATLREVNAEATAGERLLISAAWPAPAARDVGAEDAMQRVIAATREVRDLRTQQQLPAGEWRSVRVASGSAQAEDILRQAEPYLGQLWRARPLEILLAAATHDFPEHAAATALGYAWIEAGGAEVQRAAQRAQKQRAELEEQIRRVRGLLASEGFLAKAPPQVVQRERERLAELEERLAGLDVQ
ncbi:MAG TPA: class I tRNA ligase family protein, partial [Candidatus Limnocylindria bacterium]|nr:class I tRNA ligase family protein [Candidatus Limnocylindria bacterium]